MKDPLAKRRQRINEGEAYSLIWTDTGIGCPVDVGQVFQLRACRIEITKTHRIHKKQAWEFEGEWLDAGWYWRAEFDTYWKTAKTQFLARRGGITSERRQAMPQQDSPDPGTLHLVTDDERDPVAAAQHRALGEAPEPALSDHEIRELRGSREARQRYELDMAERRMAEASAPLEQRLARLREMAGNRHVDISRDLRVIEQRVAAIEDKVLERAAA